MRRIPTAALVLAACLMISPLWTVPAWATEYFSAIADLPVVLACALASRRPRLIDVPVDPSGYPALLKAIRG